MVQQRGVCEAEHRINAGHLGTRQCTVDTACCKWHCMQVQHAGTTLPEQQDCAAGPALMTRRGQLSC